MSSNIKIQKLCKKCGAVFTAYKTSTNYCSHKCTSSAYKARKRQERIEIVEQDMIIEHSAKPFGEIKDKEFLTPSETATLLSVGRSTIYRYLMANELKSLQMKGKTFIRRKDIDAMFDNAPTYRARPNKEHIPILEFYTVTDIKQKFKIKESWIFKIAKENKIPKTLNKGKSYFSKKHVDSYFKKKSPNEDITEWSSVKELEKLYGLSVTAIYSFVSENKIPKKKDGRTVFYSKKHFDIAKKYQKPEKPQFYSTEEAMQKFNLTRDALYHYVRYHNIPKIKAGRYIKISKREIDQIFEQPIIL